jgi:hypothetical protein
MGSLRQVAVDTAFSAAGLVGRGFVEVWTAPLLAQPAGRSLPMAWILQRVGPAQAVGRHWTSAGQGQGGGAAGIAPLPTASFHSLPLAALLVIPNLAVPRTPRCSRLVRTAPLDAARPGESSASRGSDAGLPCFWKTCALCSVLRRDETSNGAAASGAGALSLLSAMASLRMLQI